MTDYLEIHIIELPKAIEEYKINPKDGVLQWMMFWENPENVEVTKIMEENDISIIQISKITELSIKEVEEIVHK